MPILFYASRFPESRELLGKHKKLKHYFERHVARKSVQETMPEKYAAELKAEQEAKAQAKAAGDPPADPQGSSNEPSPASA
jgi:hypothetical protein